MSQAHPCPCEQFAIALCLVAVEGWRWTSNKPLAADPVSEGGKEAVVVEGAAEGVEEEGVEEEGVEASARANGHDI